MKRLLMLAICIFVVGLMVTAQSYAKIDSKTIVGIWLLDEGQGTTTKDSSVNGNNGKLNGTKWVNGQIGKALEFNGSTDFVECTGNKDALNTTTTMTVTAWIKTPQPTKNFQMFVTHGQAVWELRCNSTTGTAHFCAQIGAVWIDQTEYSTKTILKADTWYHVAGTFDGKRVTTFINGVDDGHYDAAGTIASSSNPVHLGKRVEDVSTYSFIGDIDEVGIFNVALPDTEIKSLMNGLSPAAVISAGKLSTTWGRIKE